MKKIFLLILIITVFSFSAIAQPGGGGGGGPSGGGPSGGGPGGGGPGGHGNSGPDLPGKTGDGMFSPGRSGGGTLQNDPFNTRKSSEKQVVIQYFINYRGMRKPISKTDLQISNIEAQMTDHKTLRMDIHFNQSINPLSVKASRIEINGNSLPDKTRFIFNKKGDSLRFSTQVSEKNITMNIKDIESYTGSPLDPYEIQMETTK